MARLDFGRCSLPSLAAPCMAPCNARATPMRCSAPCVSAFGTCPAARRGAHPEPPSLLGPLSEAFVLHQRFFSLLGVRLRALPFACGSPHARLLSAPFCSTKTAAVRATAPATAPLCSGATPRRCPAPLGSGEMEKGSRSRQPAAGRSPLPRRATTVRRQTRPLASRSRLALLVAPSHLGLCCLRLLVGLPSPCGQPARGNIAGHLSDIQSAPVAVCQLLSVHSCP